MTVSQTTNLSLPIITTGTESGAWGDIVDNGLTSYLDIAIAGSLSITITSADITLSTTSGTSSGTNIVSTGATGSTAQYAILNISGAMTAARNLILPSVSKWYIVNNSTSGNYALTIKGSATTGVTLINGEKAIVVWNGSDFIKMANVTLAGTETLSNKTITGTKESIIAITDGPAFEIGPSGGGIQTLTLTASRTPKATNFAAGQSLTLAITAGAYTLTWTDATWGTSGVKWVGASAPGSAPTLSTTNTTFIELWKIGSQVYGALVGIA